MLSLENIRSVFKSSPLASVIFYPDSPVFTIAEANEAFLLATKTSREDLIGKGLFEAFPDHPDDPGTNRQKKIRASIGQVILLKKAHQIPLQRYKMLNQVSREYEAKFWNLDTYPLLDDNEQVQFLVQSIVEITDKILPNDGENAINNKLLLDSDFQHPLFNDYPDAVYTLDVKGNFLSVNKVMADMAECSADELINSSFIPLIQPQDFEKAFDNFQNAIKGEIINFDVSVKTLKGNLRNLNITNLPIIINKKVIGVYGIARDITAAKQAEKQIEKYHKQIENILESFTDGFLAVDPKWTVTYWNKEAENILFRKRDKIINRNLWEEFPEAVPLKFYTECHRAMAENISVRFEEYFPPLKIWIELSVYPSDNGLSIYFKDVTSRRNAEDKINQEKEKYLNLFNMNPLPQWVFDLDTLSFLDINEAAVRHYGYSREEFLSMTIRDIRPIEEVASLEKILNHSRERGIFNQSLVRHQKKSGEVIRVNVEGNAIQFEGKNARLVLATDVTEKIKAEQSLMKSEQRFKALVQEGSDLIGILNSEGNYQYVSPTSKTILGIEAASLINKNAFDYIHEDDQEMVAAQFGLLTLGKRIAIPPFRFKDINNNYRWIETVLTDMRDDAVIEGIVANSRDVTLQIESENKIREGLERYNTVSKATSDTIYDWNLLTNDVIWNKGIKGIFGYDQTDFSSRSLWFDNIHPEDSEDLILDIQRSIDQKKSRWRGEYRFRDSDGNYRNVLDRSFLTYDEKSGLPVRMIGAMQDITERVNYIQAIEEQNKKLREIAWFQSHVVRAPLARVMGLIYLLKNYPDDEYPPEMLEYILTSAQELDDVIRSIIQRTAEVEE